MNNYSKVVTKSLNTWLVINVLMTPTKIKDYMSKLLDNGYEAYVIGGAIRDKYFGITPKDYDIFTNATGEEILKIFPEGKIIGGEERQEKILTVIVDDVEISQYRNNGTRTETGTDLLTHLSTCDFTMNAIAMDVNGKIIDPHDGRLDIHKRLLTWVGNAEERVLEDPLRLFRGVRFICKYDLTTKDSIILSFAQYINSLPKERIRDELMKILVQPSGFKTLLDFGMITYLFPEYNKCVGLPGGDYHDETVCTHLILTCYEAIKLSNNPLFILTAFLHDIGKAKTFTDDEGIHFYGHEREGAKIAESWMKEYKFSNEEITYVKTLIYEHMYGRDGIPGNKSLARFFTRLEDAHIPIEDFVALKYCDNQGNRKSSRKNFLEFLKKEPLLQRFYQMRYSEEPMRVTDLKINGHDMITLGLRGHDIGLVLNYVLDQVYEGLCVNRRAEQLELATRYINNGYKT